MIINDVLGLSFFTLVSFPQREGIAVSCESELEDVGLVLFNVGYEFFKTFDDVFCTFRFNSKLKTKINKKSEDSLAGRV